LVKFDGRDDPDFVKFMDEFRYLLEDATRWASAKWRRYDFAWFQLGKLIASPDDIDS
jgi:hypothetical protein